MSHEAMIDEYLAGTELLRQAIVGMTDDQLDAKPVPGKWSTRQVVCHLADFEPIYADRMKRVIAEPMPNLLGGSPDKFAANLAYEKRPVQDELILIAAVRRQMATILRALSPDDFRKTGNHSRDGALTLEALLRRITEHIPHHVRSIGEKRRVLDQ